MSAWVLSICIGVSWAGCGSFVYREYPSEDSCYRALSAMKSGDQPISESNKKRNNIAFCAPKDQKK